MNLNRIICVCGAGTMGSGIAQVAAQAGYVTFLYDLDETVLERARQLIRKNLDGQVVKGRMEAKEADQLMQRISFTNRLEQCRADIYIEAIIEDPSVKISLFRRLEEIGGNSIYASNTSSLALTTLAESLVRKERMIGMHFFNPAPVMKLVEVVTTRYTSKETVDEIMALAAAMGKVAVLCRDSPGFIVNRVARPFYLESLRMVEKAGADFVTMDRLLEATGFRMGPFKLMDLIGNDVNYAVSCSVYEQLGSPARLRPSPIQADKVRNGELGRKTGRGYYDYGNEFLK